MPPAAHVSQSTPFRWSGIDELVYKDGGTTFRDVTRRVLFGEEHGNGVEVRYFEIAAGGHTTLERHGHTHSVMPLTGAGRCLVGETVYRLALHDLVHVPEWTWHQFRADEDAPLGILCVVRVDRDRPTLPTQSDLAALRRSPAAEFIRV